MYDYLKDHALKNVWCTPDQDNELIIQPAKLTPFGGALHTFRVMARITKLPDTTSHWHVYQIGQIPPNFLGLIPSNGGWKTFSDACNASNFICDLYNDNGIELPRFESWYMFNEDRDLIVAIRNNVKIPYGFDSDNLYIRFYSNAFFASGRENSVTDMVKVIGVTTRNTAEVLAFQNLYQQYDAKPGAVYAFVNGVKVTAIDLIQMSSGDTGEFVYDSSIKKIVTFTVGSLSIFESILDGNVKYLLHYPGDTTGIIEYRDDVDVFLTYPLPDDRYIGVYYHKNQNDAFRMVTHRDYSVPTPYVYGYYNQLQTLMGDQIVDPHKIVIQLHIRKSGYTRPLINESNRIAELYKMSDSQILGAMIGTNAVVPNWAAANLENSDYVKIMDSKCCDITNQMVDTAYGYNSISKIIGNTPQVPYLFSGRKIIDLPYGLQFGCTAYEYDIQGFLLGWYTKPVGTNYECVNNDCVLVEVISGIGGSSLTDKRSANNIVVDIKESYRVYKNNTSSVGVAYNWTDITGTDKYAVISGILTRTDGGTSGNFIVRNEKSFLALDMDLSMSNGELRFPLTQLQIIGGIPSTTLMEIPMGQIDVFLNNRSLIRGLDYYVKFPEIGIINKEYLIDPSTTLQKIHVRFTGYCDSNMQLRTSDDVGFIEHGVVSNNSKFNLRDDRVLRIIVGGRLYTKDKVQFSEQSSTNSNIDASNGRPYSIQPIIVPLKSLTNEPTFAVKDRSVIIDTAVSNYLTIKIPQPVRTGISVITNRYVLFSPFICKIIFDLKNGVFDTSVIQGNYSDQQVVDLCQPYLSFLTYDPTQQAVDINTNYVIVHPHCLTNVIDLEIHSYIFIQKVVKLFTNDKVTLSPFVRLQSI